MEQNIARLERYFEEQIALHERLGKTLFADERKDEAAFERVKANVYDIFRTVLAVAVNTAHADPDAVRCFFLRKVDQIPASWQAACDRARQHQDTVKEHLEQLKLDTAAEIRESFIRLWEDAQ